MTTLPSIFPFSKLKFRDQEVLIWAGYIAAIVSGQFVGLLARTRGTMVPICESG
jgi:hypothetical protein